MKKSKKMICCALEALVTVGGRGQVIIPKEVREITDIHAGEKLVVVTSQKEGETCNILLIKAENFTEIAGQPDVYRKYTYSQERK